MTVGFIGLGKMGLPMALNLVRAGTPLIVWNRSSSPCAPLRELGATVAATPAEVFGHAEIVVVMLADGPAIDLVLQRGTDRFAPMVAGRVLVHMGTTPADYSHGLQADVVAAGGRYVEAPVSGSRGPAAAGELVGMLAGPDDAVDLVAPLLDPVCSMVFRCGAVPAATRMKLAVNLFLVTQVVGLVEAYHLAERLRLDLAVFRSVLDAGPMPSAVSRAKLRVLVEGDFVPQASVSDVHYVSRLVAGAAAGADVSAPLMDVARDLFGEAEQLGHGDEDMAAVLRALQARTHAR
ncbi:NAD(P)-dependent oxidoreductase [Arsenicicoccus bolidensis]|uniref:NAD(P)-dependent oxidoreductase n=1 Tax=Arsenicicoccus bolidensis TaxID=229480 RepID=UPI00041234C7|nr:NAD(P)-dependent oxidoreductase [Arsenicicoccus bolidensis]